MDGSDPKTFAKICNRTLRRADTPPRSRGGCPCSGDRWIWGGFCPTERWERVAGGKLGRRLLGGGSLVRVADRWSGVSAGVGFCVVLVIRYTLTDSASISTRPRHVSLIYGLTLIRLACTLLCQNELIFMSHFQLQHNFVRARLSRCGPFLRWKGDHLREGGGGYVP